MSVLKTTPFIYVSTPHLSIVVKNQMYTKTQYELLPLSLFECLLLNTYICDTANGLIDILI